MWRRCCLFHAVVLFLLLAQTVGDEEATKKHRVAIIGGGVSGTFATKYLVDYDQECSLESVTVFDPNPIGKDTPLKTSSITNEESSDTYWQGSRVASIKLQGGTIVEIGASIGYTGFYYVTQMLEGDDKLEQGPPFYSGKDDPSLKKGLGIYDGDGNFAVLTSNTPSFLTKLWFLWRYNIDFIRLSRATSRAEGSFALIHQLLDKTSALFDSPQSMWETVGLSKPVNMPYSDFLDQIGLTQELSWWRKYLPYQGSLREELVTAINLCNYNQDNSKLNALVGLGSFASTKGKLFSVVGGNHQLLQSAMQQAQTKHESKCQTKGVIRHVQQRVTSVVGDYDGMQLFGTDNEDLGEFDVVILAAPLQQSRISFLIRSHMDGAVLQPMPLNGMVDAEQGGGSASASEGHDVLPKPLPSSATRPYTSVVTTVVSGVESSILAQHFALSVDELPRSVLVTEKGKRAEGNITAVTQVTSDGVYKTFSSERLKEETLASLFGKHYAVEHVQVWGGPYGGATPDFQGEGRTMNYLLYDSGLGLEGHTGGALFYPNAIEASFACMELSAIGAKSVAKLVANHLGLTDPTKVFDASDEL